MRRTGLPIALALSVLLVPALLLAFAFHAAEDALLFVEDRLARGRRRTAGLPPASKEG